MWAGPNTEDSPVKHTPINYIHTWIIGGGYKTPYSWSGEGCPDR